MATSVMSQGCRLHCARQPALQNAIQAKRRTTSPTVVPVGSTHVSRAASQHCRGIHSHILHNYFITGTCVPIRRSIDDQGMNRRHSEGRQRGICRTPSAALVPTPELAIAASVFTLCTAAVIPLYTLMLLAPDRPLTRRVMKSSIPWILLGVAYIYLLALSWTPQTLPSMFSSKYWLPELGPIAQMFSSPLTVASAWIHLLALDLYAAKGVYFEGLELGIETRHSLCLCLMFAPIGVLCHALTKALVTAWKMYNTHSSAASSPRSI